MIRLFRNSGLRDRLGLNGRKYVKAHHDWVQIAARLEKIYQDTMNPDLQGA